MSTTRTRTIEWQGASGARYKYWIYPLPPNFDSVPGNYLFAKEVAPGKWRPIYVGQTNDLSERFDSHHKAACFKRNGATHIHAHAHSGGEAARLAEERDLKLGLNPTCNG
ncbi:GIY-YIG nuclease family protein [uncultured Roseobacter sp.]|uniref:GIY-YIG nuclease family protein n=1 Tax=uncultured Roseobacter sp. TaxID=114847 RepID=UPI0026037BA5|nr:GIY-YIG nuclease family protein [uncultured Roseobacter sp.]